ncbi:MAG: hypothetical protein LBO67_04655 [Spirochaetaceae bacterium]|jgi:hypothetical protein|nr:hypothetical protein [Spirochaetaceae bacterium]
MKQDIISTGESQEISSLEARIAILDQEWEIERKQEIKQFISVKKWVMENPNGYCSSLFELLQDNIKKHPQLILTILVEQVKQEGKPIEDMIIMLYLLDELQERLDIYDEELPPDTWLHTPDFDCVLGVRQYNAGQDHYIPLWREIA